MPESQRLGHAPDPPLALRLGSGIGIAKEKLKIQGQPPRRCAEEPGVTRVPTATIGRAGPSAVSNEARVANSAAAAAQQAEQAQSAEQGGGGLRNQLDLHSIECSLAA